ncbi:MAG TPA: hypothetical protein VFI49_01170 [Rudaea sp.]|nr:hypothetical protein [Rudaea sp.]
MAAFLLPWTACMPEMQEQLPAGASMAERGKTKRCWLGKVTDMPEMQEQFPAGA